MPGASARSSGRFRGFVHHWFSRRDFVVLFAALGHRRRRGGACACSRGSVQRLPHSPLPARRARRSNAGPAAGRHAGLPDRDACAQFLFHPADSHLHGCRDARTGWPLSCSLTVAIIASNLSRREPGTRSRSAPARGSRRRRCWRRSSHDLRTPLTAINMCAMEQPRRGVAAADREALRRAAAVDRDRSVDAPIRGHPRHGAHRCWQPSTLNASGWRRPTSWTPQTVYARHALDGRPLRVDAR